MANRPNPFDPKSVKKAKGNYINDRVGIEDDHIYQVEREFITTIKATKQANNWDKIVELIESGATPEKVIQAIKIKAYDPKGIITQAYKKIAALQAKQVSEAFGEEFKPTLQEAMISYLKKFGANEVKYINDSNRDAIRQTLVSSAEKDISISRTANSIKSFIGLSPDQAASLQQYGADLYAENLPDKAVWQLMEVRGEEMLKARATLIATEETMDASQHASYDVVVDAVDQGLIDPSKQVEVWVTVPDDGHICADCLEASGSERELSDGNFEATGTPYPHDMHIGCRCSAMLRDRSISWYK